MSRPDPLGRAMLEYQRGEYERGELQYVDGESTQRGYVEGNYFGDPFESRNRYPFIEGPVLDVGCGAGRDALRFQEEHEILAVDVSPNAVRAARERGVERTAVMDMFDLPIEDGAFRTVHCFGTQIELACSIPGIAQVLSEFARVTDADGRAVVDAHDPTADGAEKLFGYRVDPRPGLARRAYHFEYAEEVGRTLAFVLLSADRFREAATPTEWKVEEVLGDGVHYEVLLRK